MSDRYRQSDRKNKRQKKKVIKYHKPININLGVIVFGIIFIYIMLNVFRFFKTEHTSIYEVSENNIADDNTCKGVIIRDETVVTTDSAGYVNYFLRDSARAAKNSIIYTIDGTGDLFDTMTGGENVEKLSSDESMRIGSIITSFQKIYSDNRFNDVYDLKYDIDNALYEATNYSMIQNLDSIRKENKKNSSFQAKTVPLSGIISYSIDQMEDLKAEDVSDKTFENADYKRIQLRTDKLVEEGSPIYKIVTSENWSIIISLTKEQHDRIQSKKDPNRIRITFPKDDLTIAADIECYQKESSYFAKLTLDNYMIRYINERFIDVELTINSAEGLKIPLSAIIEKEFFQIPLEYFTVGGNSNSTGLTKEVTDKNGNLTYLFIPTDKYYEDDAYVFIDIKKDNDSSDIIQAGDWIHNPSTNERYQINLVGKLTGVYNVNKGYAIFRRIEKEYQNKEYCIIKNNSSYGISAYDHIILNAHLIDEQAILH